MTRHALALAAALIAAPSFADDPATPPQDAKMKLPDVDSKEWKPLGTDGLMVWDVKAGEGEPIKKGETVTIHYTGWLTDGTVFDSSRKRSQMARFPLGNLIKGWQEGIPGMKPGGVRRLKIPFQLAYGENGRSPTIPPRATLVFEIEAAAPPPKCPDLTAKEWKPLGDGKTGIRVWDVTVGDGAEVKPGATVKLHYTGWLTDGKQFDSSRGGEPIEFALGDLIQGWQLAVPGMKVGGRRRIELPYQYGYGEQGSPPIPGKATLVFDIEVLGTK